MSEYKVKLAGWQVIVGVVVLIGLVGVRIMTFSDKTDDDDLMEELELLLMTDYFPDDVERLGAVLETGDRDKVGRVAKSITSTKLNIESVQVSSPLFSFSTSKDVVVKVGYSLIDASGTRDKGTKYYRFNHGSLVKVWQYKFGSNVISYYLNFF